MVQPCFPKNKQKFHPDMSTVPLETIRTLSFFRFLKTSISGSHTYAQDLRSNVARGINLVEVDMQHIDTHQDSQSVKIPRFQSEAQRAAAEARGLESISSLIRTKTAEAMSCFEAAARLAQGEYMMGSSDISANPTMEDVMRLSPPIQVRLTSTRVDEAVRVGALEKRYLNQFVQVRGIIIARGKPKHKAVSVLARCRRCGHETTVHISGSEGMAMPSSCMRPMTDNTGQGAAAMNNCGPNPYVVDPDRSSFIATQTMKIQELPEHGTAGLMPQTKHMVVDRGLVNAVPVGTRVRAICIYTTFEKSAKGEAVRTPYLRVLGMMNDDLSATDAADDGSWNLNTIAPEMGHPINYLTEKIIAPHISGHHHIKQAVAAFLFGGTRITTPDIHVRGDIHCLLLGDPGTAKSQFLKWTEDVAPISVYTSGKGSSAAGLTAAVSRDSATGEFYLEGGAMVRGDGGIVCIDEFDKMDEADRVAIHEGLEQQTISIAKAGITTMLNSRCGVLAAANPVFGTYREDEAIGDQIDFQTTILSRFDMIFLIKDTPDHATDTLIAQQMMAKHSGGSTDAAEERSEVLTHLTAYIRRARQTCFPRLTEDALRALQSEYVTMRRARTDAKVTITHRQLEAMSRIAEACARMRMDNEVNAEDVSIAVNLFKNSTMKVAEDVDIQGMTDDSAAFQRTSHMIVTRVSGTAWAPVAALEEAVVGQGVDASEVRRVLHLMVRGGRLQRGNIRGHDCVKKVAGAGN